MKYLLYFARVFVGSLFIISGLIKANDPLGFSYKLGEYFEAAALGLPALEPYALGLAMLACLAEIVLGFAVIFGGKMKVATIALVGLTVFFGWLTLYTATCDTSDVYMHIADGVSEERPVACVTDCGCFGDAMKGSIGRSLTPWESFYKDLVLFIFIVPLFLISVFGKGIKLNTASEDAVLLPFGLVGVLFFSWLFTWYFPIVFTLIIYAGYLLVKRLRANSDWGVAAWVALASVLFMYSCYTYLPMRDYRPYAEGQDIVHNMKTAEELGLEPTITYVEYTLVNQDTQEKMVLDSDVYMKEKWWEKKEWKINGDLTSDSKVRKYGYETPIPDLVFYDSEGDDMTDAVIANEKPVMLLCTYNVELAENAMESISKLADEALAQGYVVYGVSASGSELVEAFRHDYQLQFPYLSGDEKIIKTIVRSNPGLVLIDQGVVKAKWSLAQVPNMAEVQEASSAE